MLAGILKSSPNLGGILWVRGYFVGSGVFCGFGGNSWDRGQFVGSGDYDSKKCSSRRSFFVHAEVTTLPFFLTRRLKHEIHRDVGEAAFTEGTMGFCTQSQRLSPIRIDYHNASFQTFPNGDRQSRSQDQQDHQTSKTVIRQTQRGRTSRHRLRQLG